MITSSITFQYVITLIPFNLQINQYKILLILAPYYKKQLK